MQQANAMTIDYHKMASEVVAIQFPLSGRPPLYRCNYLDNPKQWPFIVKEAYKNRDIAAILIREDTPEGRAIVNGTAPETLSESYLLSLDPASLRSLAQKYHLKVSGRSTQRTLIAGIMSAVENDVKPDADGE